MVGRKRDRGDGAIRAPLAADMAFGPCEPTRRRATVAVRGRSIAVSIGTVATGPLDRLLRPRSRSAFRHTAALLAVGGAIAVLELRILDLDHGTHLLVVLTLVIGIALLFGSGPAATALAVGGVVATVASAITVDRVLDTPHAYVQVLAYLLAGTAFVVLVPVAVHDRRHPAGPIAGPARVDGGRPGPIESLTAREHDVLRLAASGISVDEIAGRLFVSPNTVKTHLTHIYGKLGVRGRSDAVRAALHCGWLTPNDICPHLPANGVEESPIPVTAANRNG